MSEEQEIQYPRTRIISEDYDQSNILHWAKWCQAGRPSEGWKPEIAQTQDRKGARWIEEAAPEVVTTWEDYDPENQDHVRRAELNKIQDPVGTDWKPTITYHLIGGQYVLQQAPVPTSGSKERFSNAVEWAKDRILDLKAAAKDAQVAAGIDESEATTNGVLLFVGAPGDDSIFSAVGKYEQAGGHPVAAANLLGLIKAKNPAWLNLPGVLAVFESYLG